MAAPEVLSVALVGCGKSKVRAEDCPPEGIAARRLYTGGITRAHLAEAEATHAHVYIISAHYYLLRPDDLVHLYDVTLNRMNKVQREEWAGVVLARLARLYPAGGVRLVLYAGDKYVSALRPCLPMGWELTRGVTGTQGARLRELKFRRMEREMREAVS